MPSPRPKLWDDLQLLGGARNGVSAVLRTPLPQRLGWVDGAKCQVLTSKNAILKIRG